MRTIVTTILAAVVLTLAPATAEAAQPHRDRAANRHATGIPTRPCAAEDGPAPCFWDAGVRGNHRGASFWLTRKGKRTCITFLDPRMDRQRGGCFRKF